MLFKIVRILSATLFAVTDHIWKLVFVDFTNWKSVFDQISNLCPASLVMFANLSSDDTDLY